jgi:hypothetical protein
MMGENMEESIHLSIFYDVKTKMKNDKLEDLRGSIDSKNGFGSADRN